MLERRTVLLVLCFNVVVVLLLYNCVSSNFHLSVRYPQGKDFSLFKREITRWLRKQQATDLPIIYVITPTYARASQMPDMTRLANTLRNVERMHWIVVEDGLDESPDIQKLLANSGISMTYLIVPRPAGISQWIKGVAQRNAGLRWIRQNHDPTENNGVLYFADDDNSYSIDLFKEMRYTKKISIWPVGFAGETEAEYPIVKDGKVVGFAAYYPRRTFAVDMAGFALNVKVLFDYPKLKFQYNGNTSFQETEFLTQCCTREELEPKADNCTKVLVWHTKTLQPQLGKAERLLFNETFRRKKKFRSSDDSQSLLAIKETAQLLYKLKAKLLEEDEE